MKARHVFVCQSCGHQESKWLGRCPSCQTWGSLVEELVKKNSKTHHTPFSKPTAFALKDVPTEDAARHATGIEELDRVLGGGLIPGALILVGGDPGIGKSTLLLQALGTLATQGACCLYVTAEESVGQVKMRADRLGLQSDQLFLLAETSLESIDATRKEIRPNVMVIDSIQTVGQDSLESAIGSVAQIRAVTHQLMSIAKKEDVTIFVVGHVTKEGAIAGPKVMEHMVDTVLYFEGERTGPYRLLRAHKNRFGSAKELGLFEMDPRGLRPVSNPSKLFLSQRSGGPGAVVVTSVEGTRPILLEVQALTTKALYGAPRRITVGFDAQRTAMLCAVLERRAGFDVSGFDVYVNMAGGVRITEPAVDLGVMLALASTMQNRPVPSHVVAVGEVGLSGEIRAVSFLGERIQEAEKLGFTTCLVPKVDVDRLRGSFPALGLQPVGTIEEALERIELL